MANELTTRIPTEFTFKSAALNDASKRIAAIASDMGNSRKELAKVLGSVLSTKCYEEDGFKSVADYAEQTFGIKKALAHQLAKVGNRFYLNESETAHAVAELLPISNLAEIAKLDDEEIAEAIDNGDITADSTQSELRELAKGATEPAIVPQYDIYTSLGLPADYNNIDLEELKEKYSADAIITAGTLKFEFNGKTYNAKRVILETLPNGKASDYSKPMLAFYAVKVEKPKKTKKGKKRVYTQEEVDALIAQLRAEQ